LRISLFDLSRVTTVRYTSSRKETELIGINNNQCRCNRARTRDVRPR